MSKTFTTCRVLTLLAAAVSGAAQDAQKPIGVSAPTFAETGTASEQRPNIIFILTDDQDLQMESLAYMPFVDKHLRAKGTFYKNHFVTTALCCPSRVSLWTGKQAHNTNVTDVNPPYGGYPKFVERGYNEDWFPIWLQNAGYDTYYTGKLFNAHTVNNYNSPHIKGFNGSDFLLDPYTYQYLHAHYQRNHDAPVNYTGSHTADVLAKKALGFLDDALIGDQPFLLGVAPVSPHSNVAAPDYQDMGSFTVTPPIPAARHAHLFPDATVPRRDHFNPDKPSGANWISKLPKLSDENVEYNDHFYRSRLRALQSVDELLDDIIKRLSAANALDNTYIFYTADNGYHLSQHRMQAGKETAFEEDIRVPMFIRGPGVPEDHVVDTVTTHIDLAPTMFTVAGIEQREDFDGAPIPLIYHDMRIDASMRHEHVTVEYWGMALEEGPLLDVGKQPKIYYNNTYKSLRILAKDYDFSYSVWCTNEHQLYDLKTDPYELHNLYPTPTHPNTNHHLLGYPLTKVLSRLDALLMVLKSCKGVTCTKPWDVLHPVGDVKTLQDALHTTFDVFYEEQVKVEYGWCEFGYILAAEGPQVPNVYNYKDGVHWSEWV